MTGHRHFISFALSILAVCAVAVASQTPKQTAPAKKKNPTALSAQQVFKRVSPSVMVMESLDAKGKVATLGSGVVIASGRVITNRHVIEDGVSFRVVHNDNKWPAKLIKVDPDHDLAELSVAGLDAPAVTVLDSSRLAVGETVYAIGAPEGLELTISEGLISGLRDFDKGRVIQTSAAISPGSSGGGLFDARGRLVGITTFYLKEGQSLNFALPAEWTIVLNRQPLKTTANATESSPDMQALIWFITGCKAEATGDYKAAVGSFKKAVVLRPNLEAAWVALGDSYKGLGQLGEALGAYQEALRLEPSNVDTWFDLGDAYAALGQHAGALSAYQKAISLKPDDAYNWSELGRAYEGLGEHDKAVQAYQKALQLKPGGELAGLTWGSLGLVYFGLDEYGRAADAFRKSLHLVPDSVIIWDQLSAAYDGLDQYDKAASAEEQAIRLNPDYEQAWFGLGYNYDELGQHDKAIGAYREAIRLKPDDEGSWLNLGWVYLDLGQYDKAISAEQEAVRLKPSDAKAWLDLGLGYKGNGQQSEVIKVYEKLKNLNPELADKFFREEVLPWD